ncbi:MAG: hypothetical protein SOZ89_01160 [Peptoniphilaceae bacterium]|nr:hypothetical protein [Peptoniphilaceae bacterium]MDD7382961.1 hypothetical protein [Peptoniphilaceae bacterium]MDY3737712.1 hypothetical protein [Peptoniphilaceae bacterium]
MRKIKILVFTILIFIFSSCTFNNNIDIVTDTIEKPQKGENLLKGTWEVDALEAINKKDFKIENEIGDKLIITNSVVGINNDYSLNPNFSAKYVNLKTYLKSKGIDKLENNENLDKDVIVLNSSDGQFFSRDFIKLSDEKIMFLKNSVIYYLTKKSSSVSNEDILKYTSENSNSSDRVNVNISEKDDTTVLIGIRERVENNTISPKYNYYTYMVRLRPKKEAIFSKTEGIFFPKKDEFWKLKISSSNTDLNYDSILAYPFSLEEDVLNNQKVREKYENVDVNRNIILNYVKGDYVSFQYTDPYSSSKIIKYSILNTSEDFNNAEGLTINEIAQKDVSNDFRSKVLKEIENDHLDYDETQVGEDLSNIGFIRSKGNLILETSYWIRTENSTGQKSFPIDIATNKDFFQSGKKLVNWDQIKNFDSDAKDYIESDNKQYILIQNQDEILIYQLNNGRISEYPSISIATNNSTSIIMCEWAFDEYANVWDDEFKGNDLLHDY